MKKIKLVALIGAVVMGTMMFAGCSSDVECSVCKQTKPGSTREVGGEEVDICDDCYEAIEAIGNAFGSLAD